MFKRQATVETATYGSEFVASKTATEQIIDLRHTLRQNPKELINILKTKYQLKVKGDGPLTYHLGAN